MFSIYHYKINFWLHFFYYQAIDRIFLKTLQKSVFVDWCFFSCFHGFGEEPLNPQEIIREKTHLVKIYLQEWILIYQDNFEYFAEINVLVSIVFKMSRECNLTNESQIYNICENIFQGDTLRSLQRNWWQCVFFTTSQQISEKQLYEKRLLQLQNFVNLVEFLDIYKMSCDCILQLMKNSYRDTA